MRRVIPLGDAMTPFPPSIDAREPLVEARRLMRKLGVRHLPVTRRGELIGILTDRDVKRA